MAKEVLMNTALVGPSKSKFYSCSLFLGSKNVSVSIIGVPRSLNMSENVFGSQVFNLTIAEAKIDSFSSSPFNTMPNGAEILIRNCSIRSTG